MTGKLKPCPFCGSTNLETVSYQVTDSWSWSARIECDDCRSHGATKYHTAAYHVRDEFKITHEEAEQVSRDNAVTAWNTRQPDVRKDQK